MVCAWLGNAPTIAHKHYLKVTDEHFELGADSAGLAGDANTRLSRNESQGRGRKEYVLQENASFSEIVALLESAPVAEEGFEPPTRGL